MRRKKNAKIKRRKNRDTNEAKRERQRKGGFIVNEKKE